MSRYPPGRRFDRYMSERLVKFAAEFRVDNKLVPWEELISSDRVLAEIDATLWKQGGWPHRTRQEIRQELLRMHERWKKVEQRPVSQAYMERLADNPYLWADTSEDEDDLFMPSTTAKRAALSKGKKAASSKDKSGPSTEDGGSEDDDFMPSNTAKRAASSKGKRTTSSKGKIGPSTEAGGCVDGR